MKYDNIILPDDYYIALNNVVGYAKNIFKDNLINITLGGSGGKGKIIEGWSDLDFFIVLKEYREDELVKFMKYTRTENIHIGTTFYTINEVKNNIIDAKTKVMCFEKQNYDVNPTLFGNDVFNNIEYDEIVQNDINQLPNILHDVRRRYIELLCDKNKKVDKIYIKKLLILIKCILNSYGCFSYGYDLSFQMIKELAYSQGVNLTEIYDLDIMNSINDIGNSKEDIIKFSSFLLDFVEFVLIKKGDNKKWIRELVQEQ